MIKELIFAIVMFFVVVTMCGADEIVISTDEGTQSIKTELYVHDMVVTSDTIQFSIHQRQSVSGTVIKDDHLKYLTLTGTDYGFYLAKYGIDFEQIENDIKAIIASEPSDE